MKLIKKLFRNKYFKSTALVLLCLAGLCALLVCSVCLYVKLSTADNIKSDIKDIKGKYDCIIILGAKVFDDGRPCDMLEDRLLQGAQLYFEGFSDRIIVSGDHGRESYDEVNAMKAFLVGLGIPDEVIFTDHAGFSTYDSMYRMKDIFSAQSAIIVTQDFHLPRAVFIAESYGMKVCGYSADIREYFGVAYNYAREIPAQFKDFFKTAFSLPATYSGEKIDLRGDSSASNG